MQNPQPLDRVWTFLVLALVGEELDENDECTGAGSSHALSYVVLQLTCIGTVIAMRPGGNRIQLWVRDKTNVEVVNSIGRRLVKLLELSSSTPGIQLEFSSHSPTTNSSSNSSPFLSIRNLSSSAQLGPEVGGPRRSAGVDSASTPGAGGISSWRARAGVNGGLLGSALGGFSGSAQRRSSATPEGKVRSVEKQRL